MQLSVNSGSAPTGRKTREHQRSLKDLKRGEFGILDRLELPEDMSRRLMELGFLPGTRIVAAHCAPGGDPTVFRVDGSEIALRRETSSHLYLRLNTEHSTHS